MNDLSIIDRVVADTHVVKEEINPTVYNALIGVIQTGYNACAIKGSTFYIELQPRSRNSRDKVIFIERLKTLTL